MEQSKTAQMRQAKLSMPEVCGGYFVSQRAAFGIVGGYGATGKVVVREVLKSSDGEIAIAGRDTAKLNSVAVEFGSRVSATRLDVTDARSLEEFCSRCSVVVNCAGPVMLLRDRVAQAALHARCHYLDLAGMGLVKEAMLVHGREIADMGLSFIVSAGWMPGLTDLLPRLRLRAGEVPDGFHRIRKRVFL
jgi:saccharopine dehydrogenase (NAD+, L-lysine forming)